MFIYTHFVQLQSEVLLVSESGGGGKWFRSEVSCPKCFFICGFWFLKYVHLLCTQILPYFQGICLRCSLHGIQCISRGSISSSSLCKIFWLVAIFFGHVFNSLLNVLAFCNSRETLANGSQRALCACSLVIGTN